MPTALIALPWISVALLVVLLPLKRVRTSIPRSALTSWLLGCSIIQGVNAAVWNGNAEIRIPVWCDIVTKLLIAGSVGIPGAVMCLAKDLERYSSDRILCEDGKSRLYRRITDITFCYGLPVIVLLLHFLVQDRRFDLVADYGCFASTYPSSVAILVIWLPSCAMIIAAFGFCGATVHYAFRRSAAQFELHLTERSASSPGSFFRQLTVISIITSVIGVVTCFSVFSIPVIKPWTSWASVHSKMSQIAVLTTFNDTKAAEISWVMIPVASLSYIICVYLIGDEGRDIFKFLTTGRRGGSKKSWNTSRLVFLPTTSTHNSSFSSKASKEPEPISRASSLSKPSPSPQSVELKSGWDDMLDTPKKSISQIITRSVSPPNSSKSRSPSPRQGSRQSTATEEDASFMASTLSYLGSPPARTLGLSPIEDRHVLLSPPPMHLPTRLRSTGIASTAMPTPAVPRLAAEYKPTENTLRHSAQDDASSFAPSSVTSMLDSLWPAPPPSPPTTAESPRDPRASPTSRSPTPQSSATNGGRARRERSGTITGAPPPASAPARINTRAPAAIEALDSPQSLEFGYPLTPTTTPPHFRARPFLGSTVPASSDSLPLFTLPDQNSRSNRGEITPTGGVRPLTPKKSNTNVAVKKPSVKSLHHRLASGSSTRSSATGRNEVIYMTVVKETV